MFADVTDFSGVRFRDVAIFNKTRFRGWVDFTGARFESKVQLRVTRIEGEMLIYWEQLQNRVNLSAESYAALMTLFRNSSDRRSEAACAYDRRVELMRSAPGHELWRADVIEMINSNWMLRPSRWERITSYISHWVRSQMALTHAIVDHPGEFVSWAVCGFGYRPARPLVTGLCVIFWAALVFWNRDAVRPKSESSEAASRVTFREAVLFSIGTFIRLGYGDWVPRHEMLASRDPRMAIWLAASATDRRSAWGRVLRTVKRIGRFHIACSNTVFRALSMTGRDIAVVEALAGWLVLGLFIATLTNLWL